MKDSAGKPITSWPLVSADELLRLRVKKIRKSFFSLEKAKNLVLETADPEHAVEVIVPLLSSTQARILRSAM